MSMSPDPPQPGGTPQDPAYSERYSQYPGEPPQPPYSYGAPEEYAQNRTRVPAILLIVVGVLGLLFGLYMCLNTAVALNTSVEKYEKQMETAFELFGIKPDQRGGMAPATMKRSSDIVGIVWTILALLVSILQILGGVRLLSLRSYGLVLFAAITACIPCISCMGCCGVGQVAGIWTIAVLMDPLVRQAFFTPPGTLNYPPG